MPLHHFIFNSAVLRHVVETKKRDELTRIKRECDELTRAKRECDELTRTKRECDELTRTKRERDELERPESNIVFIQKCHKHSI